MTTSWKHFEEPASVFALAPLSGGACLAASQQGLWKWAPRAKVWNQLAPQFAQVPLSAVTAAGDTILIGSNGDIAVSRDDGDSWAIAQLPVKAHILGLAMSPAFEQDGVAFAATAKDGVLRSADYGATWHAWNFGLLDLAVNAIALSPSFAEDATLYAATDHAVFMSVNSGRAWKELGASNDAGPFTALCELPLKGGDHLFAGTEGNGLWASARPFDEWRRVKSLRADEINFLLAQPQLAATTSGVYAANGSRWAQVSPMQDVVCLAALDDGTLIAGTAGSGSWHARLGDRRLMMSD